MSVLLVFPLAIGCRHIMPEPLRGMATTQHSLEKNWQVPFGQLLQTGIGSMILVIGHAG
jgi:hypothetical protein